MNQNQNAPFEVHMKSYEEDACRTPVDEYIEQLTHDTHKGKIPWRKSHFDAGTYEHTWKRLVVKLSYEVPELGRERFTLSLRKAGDIHAPFTMVAQHVASTHAPDELRDLWQAINEFIDYENSHLVFDYMDAYIAKSKENAFSDELSLVVEEACRDIIKLVQEQKIEK